MDCQRGVKIRTYVSWDMFGQLTEELLKKIKRDGNGFDGVFGIPRGGLPLASRVSHAFNDLPILLNPTSKSLIVDDISDEGDTLYRYISKYEHRNGRPKIGCLFSTLWTKTVPDWYVGIKNNKDNWIVYPWERTLEEARGDAEREGVHFTEYRLVQH